MIAIEACCDMVPIAKEKLGGVVTSAPGLICIQQRTGLAPWAVSRIEDLRLNVLTISLDVSKARAQYGLYFWNLLWFLVLVVDCITDGAMDLEAVIKEFFTSQARLSTPSSYLLNYSGGSSHDGWMYQSISRLRK